MNFWWVNHKQTFKHEIEGGYIWSPQTDKNGQARRSYTNLTKVKPGDRIISFADAQIKAIGVIESGAEECEKPNDFQGGATTDWLPNGWLVSVDWIRLKHPIRAKSHIGALRPHLPSSHSPLNKNGDGAQHSYLADIPPQLFDAVSDLLVAAGNPSSIAEFETEAAQLEEEQEVRNVEQSSHTGYEKAQLIKARRGQGIFKANVQKYEDRCRVTAVSDPKFLVASHIKPWRLSSDSEKVDGSNGLLLAPHVDKLFDGGWITFLQDGSLLSASADIEAILSRWGIDTSLKVDPFRNEQDVYLAFHREQLFRGQLP